MYRKTISLLILLMINMLGFGLSADISHGQVPELRIIPSSVTVYEGNTFTSSVVVVDVSDLYMWQIIILFNTSSLRCTAVHLPETPIVPIPSPPYGFSYTVDNDEGRIVAAWWPPSPWPSFTGSGTLFQIEFQGLNAGESETVPDARNSRLYDSQGNPIPLPDTGIFGCHVTVLHAIHDVAVLNVNPFHPVAFFGLPFVVSITVANLGTVSEHVNVTLYGNTTDIATVSNIFLENGSSATVDLAVTEVGVFQLCFPEDHNFTLSAYAWPVKGETNTADNTFVDGVIRVVHVGDINGDGKVDIRDLAMAAAAYGIVRINDTRDQRYGQYWHLTPCPRCPHTSNADLNCDGKVDIQDIARISASFGFHHP